MKDTYFDIPAMSNSALKWFKKSPMHYKYYMDNPQPTTEAMAFGSAFHLYVLEPDKFENAYAVLDMSKRAEPDKTMASNKNKEWLRDFNEEAQTMQKSVITSDQLQLIRDMTKAVLSNGFASELISDAKNKFEVANMWEYNDIACKSKIDIVNPSFLVDLKTCADASPESFSRTIWSYEYYRQAGMYLDGMGMQNKPFYFIAIEKTAPYGVSVHKCTQELIDYGIQEYRDLVSQYKACLESGNFPGYEKDAIADYFDAELPKWATPAEISKTEKIKRKPVMPTRPSIKSITFEPLPI